MDWSGFGGSAFKTIGGFLQKSRETKAKNAVRKRQNENAAVIGAHNQGVISQTRAQIREEATSSRVKIQRARAKALASAKVSAAAAGVAGGSVDAASFDISRSAAERAFSLQRGAEQELANTIDAEYQNKVNTVMQTQSMLSGPSGVGLALGLVGDVFDARADDTGSDGTDAEPTKGFFSFLD
jgi:hypothetical protein